MTPLHLLDRLYGKGSHAEFKRCLRLVKPGVKFHIQWIFGMLPGLSVVWQDGAYMKMRLSGNTVHIQELANSSSGENAEGLYRNLVHKSGLPNYFKRRGVRTLTCEPSDDDARKRLGRYGIWEVWTGTGMHPVWVWWLKPRTVKGIHQAIGFAHSIQLERKDDQPTS